MTTSRGKTAALLGAITLFGLILRTYQLSHESAWWDEIVCLHHLHAPSLAAFISAVRHDDPPMTPGYFTAAYAWAHAVSSSVASLRMLSVLFALATMPLLYAFARRLYGSRAGLIAAFAFAGSMVNVYFAQEVRTYAFITFFALLSAYTLTRALQGQGRRWWTVHLLINALLTFTHLFATILFGVEALVLLCFAKSRTKPVAIWFVIHIVLAALLAAWLHTIDLSTVHEAASWMVTPGWREAIMAFNVFAGGRASNENPASHMPSGLSLDWVVAALVYGVIAWFLYSRWTRRRAETGGNPDLLTGVGLALWMVLPLCVLGVASYAWRPCFVYRYVLYSSLPLCVLLGAGIDALPKPRLRRLVLGAFVVLSAYQASAVLTGPFRADWQSVSQHVSARLAPNDKVVVFQCFNRVALDFIGDLPPEQMDCVEVWSAACDAITEGLQSGGAVWFPVWLWTAPTKFETCFRNNGLTVQSVDFKGWPNVRLYRLTRPKP